MKVITKIDKRCRPRPDVAALNKIRMKGNKNFLGKTHTNEVRLKISKTHKGKIVSEETKKKWRETWFSKPRKGWKHKEETKIKMSSSAKGPHPWIAKENHPNWKGGISYEPYSIDWTETLKRSIKERDKYLCGVCKLYGDNVHHIDYDKKNCNPTNLITLCRSCHMKTNYNREYWRQYFSQIQ